LLVAGVVPGRPGRGQGIGFARRSRAPLRGGLRTGRDSVRATGAGGFEIAESVVGTATTDFGALDAAPAVDSKAVTAQQAERVRALTVAAWDLFEETAAAAPAVLRKGPRGGGRDRDAMIAHVRETEVLHARMLGLKERPFTPGDSAAVLTLRAKILTEIGARASGGQVGDLPPARRPALFVARRTAWHALDHAWEMQDRHQ
jgi:hypothetical protein